MQGTLSVGVLQNVMASAEKKQAGILCPVTDQGVALLGQPQQFGSWGSILGQHDWSLSKPQGSIAVA